MFFAISQVKDVQELKSKRGGLKFKITGDVKGKKVTLTKPGDRQIPIISGGDHLTGKVTKKKEAAAVVEDKDYSVANAAAGASKTVPIRAGEVRKGGYVMLKGKPCKVLLFRNVSEKVTLFGLLLFLLLLLFLTESISVLRWSRSAFPRLGSTVTQRPTSPVWMSSLAENMWKSPQHHTT